MIAAAQWHSSGQPIHGNTGLDHKHDLRQQDDRPLSGRDDAHHHHHHQTLTGEKSHSGDLNTSSESTATRLAQGTWLTEDGTQCPSSRKREHLEWVVGKKAYVPRKVVIKSCQNLDETDTPDKPGLMLETTLAEMVHRFDDVFNPKINSEEKVEVGIKHLRSHTKRRRGQAVLKRGLIEWEQTSRIYELFTTDLNIFERIFFTVDVGESNAVVPKTVSFTLISLIFISIVTWMVGTIPGCQRIPEKDFSTGRPCTGNIEPGECAPEPLPFFKIVEKVCVITFTLEYFVRLFTAHSVRKAFQNEMFLEAVLTGHPMSLKKSHSMDSTWDEVGQSEYPEKLDGKIKATLLHIMAFSNVIDLLAIIPFWLETFQIQGGGGFLVVLRILRLTRIFRIFKVGKYNDMFTLFTRVAQQSIEALGLMIFFIILGCCLFGTLMWFAEQGEWYPEGNSQLSDLGIVGRGAYLRHTGSKTDDDFEESPFQSIIHSSWYVIVTITTVGYGDIVPKSPEGQVIGALTILNGIIVLAMPIGVVGANFSKEYYDLIEDKKRRKRVQEQLNAQEEIEEQQDKALLDIDGETAGDTDDQPGEEIVCVQEKRDTILRSAMAIDKSWAEQFPEMTHQELSSQLRFFLATFIDADVKQDQNMMDVGVTKPRLHLSQLSDLDALTTSVFGAIAAVTVEVVEFGLKAPHNSRRQWNEFTELCWEYARYLCRVEKSPSPPEYFTMKANMASRSALCRSSMFATATSRSSRRSVATLKRCSGSKNSLGVPSTLDHTVAIDGKSEEIRPTTSLGHPVAIDKQYEEFRPQNETSNPVPPPYKPPELPELKVTGDEKKQFENGADELPGFVATSSMQKSDS